MSEFNVTVDGGNSIRLKTAGKYCDRDIVVTAEGGTDELDQFLSNELTTFVSNVTSVRKYAFHSCTNLVSITLPKATTAGDGVVYNCLSLKVLDVSMITRFSSAFGNCYSLIALILRNPTIVTQATANAFNNNCTHIIGKTHSVYNPNGLKDGYIYVPRSLVDAYKAATNWVTYATQFRALEDYTVDGTTTGELDWEKVNA